MTYWNMPYVAYSSGHGLAVNLFNQTKKSLAIVNMKLSVNGDNLGMNYQQNPWEPHIVHGV